MNGRITVFKGYTDERGRFETTPLEPGVYIFQLRIPQTIINTPARYTLVLSGARPLGDALVGHGVALALNAEVRRPGPVRGHVNGRRVRVAPAPALGAQGATTTAATGNLPVVARTGTTPLRRTSSATIATPTASTPMRAAVVSTPSAASPATPSLIPRPANSQPRLVNGRRYVWVSNGPDSNLGSWVPDNTGAPVSKAAGGNVPSARSVRPPSASPTPRRY